MELYIEFHAFFVFIWAKDTYKVNFVSDFTKLWY